MSVERIINRICKKSTLRALLSVIFVINTVLVSSGLYSLVYIKNNDFYADKGNAFQNSITEDMMEKSAHDALMYFYYHLLNINSDGAESAYLSAYKDSFSEENSNFFFSITDTGKAEDNVIFSNFQSESRKDYYPDSKEFFYSVENIMLLRNTDTLSFEGHIKKELTADDAYSRLYNIFRFINIFKYILIVIVLILVCIEIFLGYIVCRCAGYKDGTGKVTESEIDRIPSYILAFFGIPVFVIGTYFLNKRVEQIFDLRKFAEGTDIASDLYTAALLLSFLAICFEMLFSTVSVRMKNPQWWQKSWVYRLIGARKNVQAVTVFLFSATVCEFGVFILSRIMGTDNIKRFAMFAEIIITIVSCYIIIFVNKNVSSLLRATRRIAVNKKGTISLHGFNGSYLKYAENINFLSKSASAKTQERYINESFSTKLINGISSNIKSPLTQVIQNVEELKNEEISTERQNECIEEINRLSGTLKKTIEDIILISKATTGNLEFNADFTDMGVFLSQIIGEYYGMFQEKNINVAEERVNVPVIVNADGRFMWYVFDSILSVICKNSINGTRVHIKMKRAGNKAVFVFRSSMIPSDGDNLMADGDLSLPTAKVFTEIQGGDIHFTCKKDIMTIVLRFPLVRMGIQKKIPEIQ